MNKLEAIEIRRIEPIYRRATGRKPTAALASATRGPNFNKVMKLVEGRAVEPAAPRSSPRRWAAFVLSGSGQ